MRQSREYYLRGWKPERIWPDFIAMAGETDGRPHLLVFETKGDHLAQTEDTQYKEHVLRTLEAAFNPGKAVNEDGGPYGAVKVRNGPMRGTFQLVFEQESFDAVERALDLSEQTACLPKPTKLETSVSPNRTTSAHDSPHRHSPLQSEYRRIFPNRTEQNRTNLNAPNTQNPIKYRRSSTSHSKKTFRPEHRTAPLPQTGNKRPLARAALADEADKLLSGRV